jgi:hypothetical protein
MDNDYNLSIIMGILAIMVVLYRIIYIGLPIYAEGFKKKDISLILKATTLLV